MTKTQAASEPPTIAAKLVKLTPALAEQLLQSNTHNRQPAASTIKRYAADIAAGRWQLNGEAIKVATDGTVLDGQHRLLAVIEADAAIETLLITGLPNATQETMDQGRTRTFADVLKLRGEKYHQPIASAVRGLTFYERDGMPIASFGAHAPTVQEMSRTLERNPEIRASVATVYSDLRKWLPATAMCTLHYLFASVDQDDADDFFRKLTRGENLAAGDPIYTLRERLMKEHYETGGARLQTRVKIAFIVKAWNAYRRGEQLNRLAWSPGGSSPDRFPEIDGLQRQEA